MIEAVDRGIFLAKSGVWWMHHPLKPGYAFSLRTRDRRKAEAKHKELLAFYQRAYVEERP